MKEGILVDTEYEDWIKVGRKLTEKGIKYHDEFIKRLREKHKHQWMTYRDSYPEDYKEGTGNKINPSAYSNEFHNGYVCKKCGFSFCEHCTSEFDIEKCKK